MLFVVLTRNSTACEGRSPVSISQPVQETYTMKLLTLLFLLISSSAIAQVDEPDQSKTSGISDSLVAQVPEADIYDVCHKCRGNKVIEGYFSCEYCRGSGSVDCSKCGGTGMATSNYNDGQGSTYNAPYQCSRTESCIYCGGHGKVYSQRNCSYCNYTGKVKRK